jgi:2',3'-cyclic-nucleotide 2'-phosphodiesterase (5'-nucleotidase family)
MLRLLVALVGLLAGLRLSAVTLTILHTSDLHGRVHPHDALADKDLGEGLARVATAVKAVRAEGHPVLLLDSGDTIQGAPTQALVFAGRIGEGSDPIVRAMDLVGYDAMAVGNHEFDFGLARLEKSRKQARFPWLCANVTRPDGSPAFAPYAVLEAGGVRVGVLGLVTPHVPNWESPALIEGLQFGDAVAAARRYVPVLRGKERCDVVVVLTHQGFERDPATGEARGGAGENQAYALATEVPGVDFVLAGHAHAVVAPRRVGTAWVSEPGRWGNTLTRFDLTLERVSGRWSVTAVRGRNLHMKSVAPDPAIVAAVEPEQQAAMRLLGEAVAELETAVSARGARFHDTALLDWLHAVQRREGKAQLSFCSLLPGELPDWPAGPLTERQMWAFYPYENGLVTIEASGRQIRAALERAADCIPRAAELARNCDSLAGAEYAVDPSRPAGQKVLYLRREGRDVADADVFTVALNSYRASGGGGYPMWKGARRVSESGNLRDMLIADARTKKRLDLSADDNWKVVTGP